jgi:3-phenylpropionate/trans-cinnamate dioxygenase ferredoxin component
MGEWTPITSEDAVAEGELHAVAAKGLYLAVARVDGRFHVFDEMCTHEECPLPDGELEGEVVTCFCHGSQFDVTTGEVLSGPATEDLQTYPTRVEGGQVLAELPE